MEDSAILPLYNGRIVSWLVAAEGSVVGVLSDARYVGLIQLGNREIQLKDQLLNLVPF